MASYAYMPAEQDLLTPGERTRKQLLKLFFLLVFTSEANAWIRFAGSNGGLKVGKQATAFSSGNGDPVLFALNALVVFVTIIFTFPKFRVLLGILLDQRALLLIYVYSFVSVLWAENVGNSFRVAVYLFFGLLQFAYIGWFLDADEQVKFLGQCVTFFAALSVFGQYMLPSNHDLAPGWAGIFPTKNYLGNVMAIGITTVLLERDRWSTVRVLKLCLIASVLALSQSFTSVVCAVVCAIAIFYLKRTRSQKLLLVGAGASLTLLVSVLLPNFVALLLGASGKDTTFTGRDVIWAFAIKYIALRPFFGYGYNGFWPSQEDAALQYLGWNPQQAHNGFLDLALNEGLVGLCILLMVFYVVLRRSLRQVREGDPTGAGRFALVMLIYVVIHNVSEADFYQHPAWLVFLTAFVASAKADRPIRYEAQPGLLEEPDDGSLSELTPHPAMV